MTDVNNIIQLKSYIKTGSQSNLLIVQSKITYFLNSVRFSYRFNLTIKYDQGIRLRFDVSLEDWIKIKTIQHVINLTNPVGNYWINKLLNYDNQTPSFDV